MTETQGGLRTAFVIALVTALASGALLYQTNIRAGRAPSFSRGGTFNANHQLQSPNLSVPTPTPTPVSSGSAVSTAVLQAPANKADTANRNDAFPPLGRYVYNVDGTESAAPFGSRSYPPQMTMTVDRPTSAKLKANEFDFDLDFSDQHKEREIVQYSSTGVAFTYEAGSITFGPGFSQSDEASYDPPMLQIPLPLKVGNVVSGRSTAIASDGSQTRVEDWSVGVLRQEKLTVLGRTFNTWVVQIHRQSEPGGTEDVDRTRTYWYSPDGNIWLKWTEDFKGAKRFGPGTFTYQTQFTATLDRVDPL